MLATAMPVLYVMATSDADVSVNQYIRRRKTQKMTSVIFSKGRIVLIALLMLALLAGIDRTAVAETLTCSLPEQKGATCRYDGSIEAGKVAFTCYKPASGDSVEKSCSRVYSPVFMETRTGLRGFNWLCTGDLTVHESALKDMKAMCAQICGICAGNWR